VTANTPPEVSAPWLSVIIPAFKGERWIATALGSLAAQVMSGVEI
jgi:hypothetical protein